MAFATQLIRSGFEFLYPAKCPICQSPVSAAIDSITDSLVCESCLAELTDDNGYVCHRCGSPTGPYLNTGSECGHCRGRKFVFDEVLRLGPYEDELRRSCIRAKSRHQEFVAAALADQLWNAHCDRFRSLNIDTVVPVPQFWLQRLWKPHNPPATIGTVLARKLQVKFDAHILSKIRYTRDQSSLSRQKRQANLRGAFRVRNKEATAGRHVLLVDDIMTTGATANEASKVLRKAGARQISVAVLAVVPLGMISTSK